MKPIEISIAGQVSDTPQALCDQFLDLARWPEFKGYAMLPGIRSAAFDVRTPAVLGSRIRVQNTDGSSHLEEIIEWDTARGMAVRFQDFTPPLRHLASHFIERWEFHAGPDGTQVIRRLQFFPKHLLGWLLLLPISRLMRRAFARSLAEPGHRRDTSG